MNFNKRIENTRNYQTEVISKLNNTPKGCNSRLDMVEKRISEMEGKTMEFTQSEQQNEKRILISENILKDLWDNIR